MVDQRTAVGPLPSYKDPPVTEVSVGLVHQSWDKLRAPHLGLLWQRIRDDFPTIEHASPLGLVVIDPANPPLPRVWFVHRDDDAVIQVQNDRYLYNWRRKTESQVYPRYEAIMSAFENGLEHVVAWSQELGLGDITPIQLGLEYVNLIPKERGWTSFAEIGSTFRDVRWSEKAFLPEPVDLGWRTVFNMPDGQGQLTVSLRHAKRKGDNHELIVLEMKAGTNCRSGCEISEIRLWYDLAREWIVRGFADVTMESVQADIWKRER